MAEEKYEEVVVVEETEHKQWTFLNYLRGIKRYKWWVLGFSVGAALVGYLGFKFVLNPSKKTLKASYTYELAGKYEDTDTLRFVDGSTFSPYDLTSREYVEKVKAENEAYAKVNVDKIVERNGITITKNVTYYNQNDADSAFITYKIEAKTSLFPSEKIGKQFIYDLVNYPKILSTQAIENYETISSFTTNFSSLTYDRQIGQLKEQYESTFKLYNDLALTFTESAIANENGEKIYMLRNTYTSSYITNGVQSFADELSNTLDASLYINYETGKENEKIKEIKEICKTYVETLTNDLKILKIYEDELKTLTDASTIIQNDTNISARITELSKQITELKIEIKDLEKELRKNGYEKNGAGEYVLNPAAESVIKRLEEARDGDTEWEKSCKAFGAKIEEYRVLLENDRIIAGKAYQYCYRSYQNRVNMLNGGYVVSSGSISNILGAGAGLLGGFVISSLVVAAVYIYRKEQ